MTRPLAALRPEPGNAATVARAAAAGFATLSLPLFAVRALAWSVPDATAHDALLLTSANTLRFGGPGLVALRALPVLAVGPHTAAAARDAGFDVMATGDSDGAATAALAAERGFRRVLHLTGRERTLAVEGAIHTIVPVYATEPLAIMPETLRALTGSCALLHSTRAAQRFAELVTTAAIDRARIAVAAFSPAIAAAAGDGWAGVAIAAAPNDTALFAAARALAAPTGD